MLQAKELTHDQVGRKHFLMAFNGIFRTVLIAFCTILFFRAIFFELYAVNGTSMQGELFEGDRVLISKIHYGARLPNVLKVPFLDESNPFVGYFHIPISTASFFDYARLPGISSVRRGDIILFNAPYEKKDSYELKDTFLKRCAAIPGDTLQILNRKLLINGEVTDFGQFHQHTYEVTSYSPLQPREFRPLGIIDPGTQLAVTRNFELGNRIAYNMHITDQSVARIKAGLSMCEVKELQYPSSFKDLDLYPHSPSYSWNLDSYGPLYIPAKDDTLMLNEANSIYYYQILRDYEGLTDVKLRGKLLYLGKHRLSEYKFKRNYFFSLGDNRNESLDLRYWGLVPEDHIIGKAWKLWSTRMKRDDKNHFLQSF
jgi:signal peptidase I